MLPTVGFVTGRSISVPVLSRKHNAVYSNCVYNILLSNFY